MVDPIASPELQGMDVGSRNKKDVKAPSVPPLVAINPQYHHKVPLHMFDLQRGPPAVVFVGLCSPKCRSRMIQDP